MRFISLLIAGFFGALAAAEILLHFLPVATGYHFGAVTGREPIAHGAPYSAYVYSRGWNFRLQTSGQLNNAGFRASGDFVSDPNSITVIGNSFIQADALMPRDTLAERLGSAVNRPAYGVGVDGFSLADYLAASRWAAERFDSRDFVVLLTTGDLKRTCQRLPGQHYLLDQQGLVTLAMVPRAAAGALRTLLNRSALYRYVFDNLRVEANWAKGWRRAGDTEPVTLGMASGCATMEFLHDASQFIIENVRSLQHERHATVWFVLAPGYRREEGFRAGDERDVDYFAAAASSAGLHVIRLQKPFDEALHAGTRLDFMPLDAHWNAAANDLAARVIAPAIDPPH